MIKELQDFESDIAIITFSTTNDYSLVELLKRQELILKLKENLIENIFSFIANMESKNKLDCLGYCIKYLTDRTCFDVTGAPWWAKYIYKLNTTNYFAYKLAKGLEMSYEYVEDKLTILAKSIESQDSIGTKWQTILKNVEQVKYSRMKYYEVEEIPNELLQIIDSHYFRRYIDEISSNITYATIIQLSEMYTFYRQGILLSSAIPYSIFDELQMDCSRIEMSIHSHTIIDDSTLEFIEILRHHSHRRRYINFYTSKPQVTNPPGPLQWLGKGTELLDLFVTLQEKGFIQLPDNSTTTGPTWEVVCRAICKLFDLSKFRRADSEGEPWQTMNTYFKSRTFDKSNSEQRYDKLNYKKRKFDDIPKRQPDLPNTE